MKKQTISIAEVYRIISKAEAKFQFVIFMKRTNQQLRAMTYKVMGSSHDTGERIPIHRVLDDVEAELLTVFDLNENAPRRINLRDIKTLVIDQTVYTVK